MAEEANNNERKRQERRVSVSDTAFDLWRLQIDIWAPALCPALLECPASRPNSDIIRVAAEAGPEGNPGSFTEISHPYAMKFPLIFALWSVWSMRPGCYRCSNSLNHTCLVTLII